MFEWWRRWARGVWRREETEQRLDEEISFHLEQAVAQNEARGMSPGEARRAALLRFGGIEPFKERVRDEVRPAIAQDFWRDVRVGARLLRRTPGFTAAAVLTIGLGSGAATAVFSVVHGVLLRPLPYPESDRIVRLYQLDQNGRRGNVSQLNFEDWQAQTTSFSAMAMWSSWGLVPVVGGREPAMGTLVAVSREFFDVMRVRPEAGRGFSDVEQRVGGPAAAIVGRAFWDRWIGGPLAGQSLRMGDRVYTVVGIMPDGFDYPGGASVWIARGLMPPDTSRTAHNVQATARLRDGVPLAAAQLEISRISRELKARYGDDTWMFDAAAVPLLDQITTTSKPVLTMLFMAAVLLLLVATANVSSLLLARTSTRQHEFAIQLAIGASRFRVVRQLLAEATVLAVAGGIVGAVTAAWTVRALVALGPGLAPRLAEARVDWFALAFAVAVTAFTALALGLLTAIGTRSVRLSSALSIGPRTMTPGRRGLVARQSLVVAQVALTLVLLSGAGLLGRSFLGVLAVNPGFSLDDALIVDFTAAAGGSDSRVRRVQLLDAMLDRVGRLPGVASAGLVTGFPLGGGNYSNGRFIEMTSANELQSYDDIAKLPREALAARTGQAGYRIASPGYFRTMGIPVLRGRVFDERDDAAAPHVAIVSQSLAESKWPGQDPIGRFVQFGNMDGDPQGFRVIGVVGDVRELTPETPPGPLFYASYRQRPNSVWRVNLIVRSPDPASLGPAIQRIAREIDPDVPVQFRTVGEAFDAVLIGRRFSLVLISLFSAAALVLATLGLYGVVAYLVAQRTREIGIRIALGATPGHLMRLILSRGAIIAVCGGLAGLAAALALARLVEGMLFGIRANDPAVLAVAAGVTASAAFAASVLPARRAARIEPATSLRST
jgi:predicted permease